MRTIRAKNIKAHFTFDATRTVKAADGFCGARRGEENLLVQVCGRVARDAYVLHVFD